MVEVDLCVVGGASEQSSGIHSSPSTQVPCACRLRAVLPALEPPPTIIHNVLAYFTIVEARLRGAFAGPSFSVGGALGAGPFCCCAEVPAPSSSTVLSSNVMGVSFRSTPTSFQSCSCEVS